MSAINCNLAKALGLPPTLWEIMKFNPYHDAEGLFTDLPHRSS
jgi:hypothetical protein